MRIRPFRAVYPNFDYITSADAFFSRVKYEYPAYKESGFFHKTAQEALYVYRIENVERAYTGIIACADIHDYLDGSIKKHENTLPVKEQQQMHLMIKRNAIVKPVLLTHPKVDAIKILIDQVVRDQPVFYSTDFAEDETKHLFWEIKNGQLIQEFQQLFDREVPCTYIADGHHRSSTMALMYERMKKQKKQGGYGQLLCALFPVDELEIYDFNRVVECPPNLSLTAIMAKLSRLFEIKQLEKMRKPRRKFEIVMLLNQECYSLQWKEKILEEYNQTEVLLDASMLDDKVMNEILDIKDTRTDTRIKYVEGRKGIDQIQLKVSKNENRIGFCLFPVELQDLIRVADLGKTMPPKSTWFEPRIKNGLIVQEF